MNKIYTNPEAFFIGLRSLRREIYEGRGVFLDEDSAPYEFDYTVAIELGDNDVTSMPLFMLRINRTHGLYHNMYDTGSDKRVNIIIVFETILCDLSRGQMMYNWTSPMQDMLYIEDDQCGNWSLIINDNIVPKIPIKSITIT